MCGTPYDDLEYEVINVRITTIEGQVKYVLTDHGFFYINEFNSFQECIEWFDANVNLSYVLQNSTMITKIADGRSLEVKKEIIKRRT